MNLSLRDSLCPEALVDEALVDVEGWGDIVTVSGSTFRTL